MQLNKVKKKTTCPTICFERPAVYEWIKATSPVMENLALKGFFFYKERELVGPHWSSAVTNTS